MKWLFMLSIVFLLPLVTSELSIGLDDSTLPGVDLETPAQIVTDTNVSTICADDEFLRGDGVCVNVEEVTNTNWEINTTTFQNQSTILGIVNSWLIEFIDNLISTRNMHDQDLNTTNDVIFNAVNVTKNLTVLGNIAVGTPTGDVPFHFVVDETLAAPTFGVNVVFVIQNTVDSSGDVELTLLGGTTGVNKINFGNTADEDEASVSYQNLENKMVFNVGGGSSEMSLDLDGLIVARPLPSNALGKVHIVPLNTGDIALYIESVSGQTANLINVVNESTVNIFKISAGGDLTLMDDLFIGDEGEFLGNLRVGTTAQSQALDVTGNVNISGTIWSADENISIFLYNQTQALKDENIFVLTTGDTMTGDLIMSDEQFIFTGTSDGADSESTGIAGGGSLSSIRGSFVRVSGNEDANTGKLFLTAGNVAGGEIRFSTGGSTRMLIDENGLVGIGTGTATPGDEFHISNTGNVGVRIETTTEGSGGFAALRFISPIAATSTQQGFIAFDDENNRFEFKTLDKDLFLNVGTGNVGVKIALPQKDFHILSTVPTIRLSDSDAGTDQAVATLIELFRGNSTNRVGFWGMSSSSNDIMALATDYTAGIIELRTGSNALALAIDSSQNFNFQDGTLTTTGTAATGALTVTGDATVGGTPVGGVSTFVVYDDSAEVSTQPGITIEQDGTGDALLQLLLSGTRRWVVGIDNSDVDKFKISSSSDLNTDARLTIDTSGLVTIPGDLTIGGSTLIFDTGSQTTTIAQIAGGGLTWESTDTGFDVFTFGKPVTVQASSSQSFQVETDGGEARFFLDTTGGGEGVHITNRGLTVGSGLTTTEAADGDVLIAGKIDVAGEIEGQVINIAVVATVSGDTACPFVDNMNLDNRGWTCVDCITTSNGDNSDCTTTTAARACMCEGN